MRRSGSKSSGRSSGGRRGRPSGGSSSRPPRRPPTGDAPHGDRLEGRNVVLEALQAGRPLRWVRIDERARPHAKLDAIRALAAERGIAVTATPRDRLDAISQTGTHNGVIAEADPLPPTPLPALLERLRAGGRAPWLVALVEGVDPDDVGAVLRTADAVGVDAVVLPPADGPLLTAGARRVAMGAAEHLPLARTALPRVLRLAREAGLRAVLAAPGPAASPGAARHTDVDLTGPLCLVLADALPRVPAAVREACDAVAAVEGTAPDRLIPLSALAAVVCYERVRQERG